MFKKELLRRLRRRKGLSPMQMVFDLDKAGLRICRPTLINWEAGNTEPKFSQVAILSKFFNVPVDSFIKNY